jgi:branched-subunit amino acid aminotransferase/4-amino-4-deoxychorismate lyase
MSVNGDFYRFDSGELVPITHALAERLSVADSFLVVDGQSIALDRHFNRFASSVSEFENLDLNDFFESVKSVIPSRGEWFPRLEYRDSQPSGQRLFLRMRQAPERTETLTLWTYSDPDLREKPRTKGPDLSLCQQIRRTANLHGADEAVLLSPEGFISDGALSSIVWVKDDTLFAPDDSTAWLPSVTREIVIELAMQAGFEVRTVSAKPSDLDGAEVWSLSALQGIRAATAWKGVDLAAPRLYQPFRKRLSMLLQPISAVSRLR